MGKKEIRPPKKTHLDSFFPAFIFMYISFHINGRTHKKRAHNELCSVCAQKNMGLSRHTFFFATHGNSSSIRSLLLWGISFEVLKMRARAFKMKMLRGGCDAVSRIGFMRLFVRSKGRIFALLMTKRNIKEEYIYLSSRAAAAFSKEAYASRKGSRWIWFIRDFPGNWVLVFMTIQKLFFDAVFYWELQKRSMT